MGTFLRNLFGTRTTTEPPPVAEPEPEERRRPAVRCNSCNIWSNELVYLSNGGHYCEPCAFKVHGWSRGKPAGRRAEDNSLERTREAGPDGR